MGLGEGEKEEKVRKKPVPTLKQTDKQSQEAMLDPTSLSPPRDSAEQHLCRHVSPAPLSPRVPLGRPAPFSQPVMPSLLPLGHWLHFMPVIPVLQEHSPVICSQSSRTEPTGSQLQAGQGGGKRKKVMMLGGWQQLVLQKKKKKRVPRALPTAGDPGRGVPALTRAAALAVGDDAAEIPEAGLAAVALEAPHARLAGALPRGGVAGPPVGAVGVALAGACEQKGGREDKSLPGRMGAAAGSTEPPVLLKASSCSSCKGQDLQGGPRWLCSHLQLLSHRHQRGRKLLGVYY